MPWSIQSSKEVSSNQISSMPGDAGETTRMQSAIALGEHTVSGLIRTVGAVRRAATPNMSVDRRVLVDAAYRIYLRRRARQRHLPNWMFGEPAWDMMLALYLTAESGTRQFVSGVIQFADAPPTTGLRYLAILEQNGFIVRSPSPRDRRMVYIELSKKGRRAMDICMADVLPLD